MKFNTFNAAMNGICAEFVTDAMCYGENRRKRLLRLPVAALIAVITALILALAAGASVIFGWDGVLKDYLGISGTRENELRNSVMEINQSQTIDGLTVTVRQAFGDAHTVYVLAEVRVPEGLPFEGKIDEVLVNTKLRDDGAVYNWLLVNKDEATRTQTYIIQLHTLKSILKKTIRIRFIDFRNVADYQNRNYFRGEFDFSFRISYKNMAVTKELNFRTDKYTVKSVTLSPVTAIISFDAGTTDKDYDIDCRIITKDGSTPHVAWVNYIPEINPAMYINFDDVIDPDNVIGIVINGVEILFNGGK